jgi:hypothetical protein
MDDRAAVGKVAVHFGDWISAALRFRLIQQLLVRSEKAHSSIGEIVTTNRLTACRPDVGVFRHERRITAWVGQNIPGFALAQHNAQQSWRAGIFIGWK